MYDKSRSKIVDRREMLRVKLKSLAAEAKIIRFEEQRTHGALRDELALHRRTVVRYEARCTHLAYGLIRGRTIDQIEPKRLVEHNTALKEKVAKMVEKYGPKVVYDERLCPRIVRALNRSTGVSRSKSATT